MWQGCIEPVVPVVLVEAGDVKLWMTRTTSHCSTVTDERPASRGVAMVLQLPQVVAAWWHQAAEPSHSSTKHGNND